MLDHVDLGRDPRLALRREVLGADAQEQRRARGRRRGRDRQRDGHAVEVGQGEGHAGALRLGDLGLEEVHARRADEAGDEEAVRIVVERERRADLLDPPGPQHDDLVGQGHGLDLVVGHVDHGRAQALVQLGDLQAHLDPQLGVEVRQGLVEEEDLGLAHDRPADRDPLALAARELLGLAAEQRLQVQDPGRGLDPLLDQRRVAAGHLEAEAHVLGHGHVRVEGVGLEDHGHAALRGVDVVDHLAADRDGPGRGLLEPGDHAQQGRLAAARGPDEDAELALVDLQRDVVDDVDRTEALMHLRDLQSRHGLPPFGWAVAPQVPGSMRTAASAAIARAASVSRGAWLSSLRRLDR